MSRIQQALYLIGAMICLILGIGLLFFAGLPDRASFTGKLDNQGNYVAPEIDNLAPPFVLSTLNFQPFNLTDLKGQVVIINFWATWCVPCRIEMPELEALHQQYDVYILGVNLGESPQSVAQWVEEFNLTYDILLDPLQSVAQLYQIRGQPSTYVLDADHIITVIYYGPVTMEQLESDIHNLLDRE